MTPHDRRTDESARKESSRHSDPTVALRAPVRACRCIFGDAFDPLAARFSTSCRTLFAPKRLSPSARERRLGG
jgi:hypothetical protein